MKIGQVKFCVICGEVYKTYPADDRCKACGTYDPVVSVENLARGTNFEDEIRTFADHVSSRNLYQDYHVRSTYFIHCIMSKRSEKAA